MAATLLAVIVALAIGHLAPDIAAGLRRGHARRGAPVAPHALPGGAVGFGGAVLLGLGEALADQAAAGIDHRAAHQRVLAQRGGRQRQRLRRAGLAQGVLASVVAHLRPGRRGHAGGAQPGGTAVDEGRGAHGRTVGAAGPAGQCRRS